MTSLAMIAGMIPMALAIGQGSEESAPLGRAVIGGLFAATLATLFLLPTVFTLPAQLVPFQTVDIYPKVTGFIDMIRVDRGSRVHKGELIIRLSAPELVAP